MTQAGWGTPREDVGIVLQGRNGNAEPLILGRTGRSLRLLAVGLLLILGLACAPDRAARPNILFIMSDDHAQRAVSAYGDSLIETPNIDRIADQGVLFANSFVTNSICAPSRAVLLTGKYSHVNGLRDNRDAFDGSQETFPKLLRAAGYETAIVGKWHLKTEPTGFDTWRILVDQGQYYNPDFIENGVTVQRQGYVTDVITDMALEFLRARDPEKPFALLYQHKAPHRNWMPDTRHLERFAERDIPIPPTFDDDYDGRLAAAGQDMRVADMYLSLDMKLQRDVYETETGTGGHPTYDPTAGWEDDYRRMSDTQRAAWDAHYDPINAEFQRERPQGDALARWKYQRYMRDYLATVASLDDNVGRLLDYLDEAGLSNDTLVVYTSDQGFYLGEHGWYDKRFMYEESLRTPLLLRYPAELDAAIRQDALVLNLDLAPTILDFAGVRVPDAMQGASLRPLTSSLLSDAPWRDAIYYRYYEYPHGWHSVRPHYGLRTEEFKLIHFEGDLDTWELFDLSVDPHELTNLYGQEEMRVVQEELHEALRALRLELGDAAPN